MAGKKSKANKSQQWQDKIMPLAILIAALFTTAGFLDAFFMIAPVEGASVNGVELIGGAMVSSKLLFSQKIFFFHMPVAIVSFIALLFAGYYAVRMLATRNAYFDTRSAIAMEISLVFVILTMVTGEMWTRFEWGVWWTWDPRLTTYLILMLLVIAYLVLRATIDSAERRAMLSSVLTIIAVIDVPICLMVTRLIPTSIHPVVVRAGGMTPEMGICIFLVLVGMLALAFVLFRARLNQVQLQQRVNSAKLKLERD